MPANLENSAGATGLEKVSFHSNPKERQCQRMLNYRTIALISHASKVMIKILQARLQQYMNRELSDVQAGFRKGRRTRVQIANNRWINYWIVSSKTGILNTGSLNPALTLVLFLNSTTLFPILLKPSLAVNCNTLTFT